MIGQSEQALAKKEKSEEIKNPKEVFYDLLSHIDKGVSSLVTIFDILSTIDLMLETETDKHNIVELKEKKRSLLNQLEQKLSNPYQENHFYKELSDFLNDVHNRFAPPEIFLRKKQFLGLKGIFKKTRVAFKGKLSFNKKNSIIETANPFDKNFSLKFDSIFDKNTRINLPSFLERFDNQESLENMSLEDLKDLIFFINDKDPGFYDGDNTRNDLSEDELKKLRDVYSLGEDDIPNVNESRISNIVSEKDLKVLGELQKKAQELYVKKRKEKLAKTDRISFDQLMEIYDRLGLNTNFDQFGKKSGNSKAVGVFLKEYFLLFSRLQLQFNMKWNDIGSKLARGTVVKPRESVSKLHMLLGKYKDQYDLIKNFWLNEVGRPKITWELTVDNPEKKGLEIYQKDKKEFGEQVSGNNLKLVFVADKRGSESSGIKKLKKGTNGQYFEARAFDGENDLGTCFVKVGENFSGNINGNKVELDGKMDAIDVKQRAFDKILSVSEYGRYPSKFELSPKSQEIVDNTNEAYLYSSLIQTKLITMRNGRNEKPESLCPLQRKEKYSVIFYFGDKRKKLMITDEALNSSPEDFYKYLEEIGVDFDNNFESFDSFDTSLKKRKKIINKSYKQRKYIQDVQKEIADPDNFEACDLKLVVSIDDRMENFDNLADDTRMAGFGAHTLDSILIAKNNSDEGKISKIFTSTIHSSADGVDHIKETEEVFTKAINIAKERTDVSQKEIKKYEEVKDHLEHKTVDGARKESFIKLDFPSEHIRSTLNVEIGDSGKSLYKYFQEKYGVKLSLSKLLVFADMMLTNSEKWTFLVKKPDGQLAPSLVFFPEYIQEQIKMSFITGNVEQADVENFVLQLKQLEVDIQNIMANEGAIPVFGNMSTSWFRKVSKFLGINTDKSVTESVLDVGMSSTTISGRGFSSETEENGAKKYSHDDATLQQTGFSTSVDYFNGNKGVIGTTEYLKEVVGIQDNKILQPYINMTFRAPTPQNDKQAEIRYAVSTNSENYINNITSIVNFFRIAAEQDFAASNY